MPGGNMKRWARVAAEISMPVLVACANLGCGEKFCVEGLDMGTTYKVTVLEPADANSQYGVQTSQGPDFGVAVSSGETCGAGFDLVAGTTFLVRPVSKVDLMSCYGRIGDVSDLQGAQGVLTQQVSGPVWGGGDLLRTETYSFQKGGCSGQWQLNFFSSNGPPLDIPVPGEYPPVVIIWTFHPSDTTDIQSCMLPDSKLAEYGYCSDGFIVKLEKT